MSITIEQGTWSQLGDACHAIRRQVFITEQHVPEQEEWDGRDEQCRHFLLRVDGQPIGTARLLPDGHIGRVAIVADRRGLGLGQQLMRAVLTTAAQQGHRRCELAAQTQALDFYRRLGFEAFGEEFPDAGIPHYHMARTLSETSEN